MTEQTRSGTIKNGGIYIGRRIACLALLMCLAAVPLLAQTTWTANGGTTDWGDAFNWSAGVPGAATPATIPTNPVGGAIFPILNVNGTAGSLTIEAGASVGVSTRILTVNGALTGAGTLNGNTGTVSVTGDITVSTYNATTGNTNVGGAFTPGVFVHNNGTVVFTGGTDPQTIGAFTYRNVTLSKSAGNDRVRLTGATTITTTLTITTGTLQLFGNTLNLNSPLTMASANGTLNIGLTGTLNAGANTVTVNNGTITASTGTLQAGGLVFGGGTYTATAAATVTLGASGLSMTSGTITANAATISTSGNVSITGGTFNYNTSTLQMTGAGTTVRVTPARRLYNFIVAPGAGNTVSINTDALSVAGTLTLTSGTLAAGALGTSVAGDFVRTGGAFTSTGTLTFNGTAAQAFNPTGSTFGSLTVNNTGPNIVTLGAGLTLPGTLTVSSGTLAVGNNPLTVALTTGNSGTITLGTQPATFTGLVTNAGGTLTGVSGAITLTAGISGGTFTATSGTTLVGGVFTPGVFINNFGLVRFNGATPQSVGSYSFDDLEIDNPTGVSITAGPVTATGIMTLSSGTLAAAGFAVNVSGDLDFAGGSMTSSGTVTVSGDIVRSGGGFSSTGTLVLAGTAAQAVDFTGSTLAGLSVTKTGGTATAGSDFSVATYSQTSVGGTFSVPGARTMTVTTSATVTAGTLDLVGPYAGAGAIFTVNGLNGAVTVGTNAFVTGAMTVSAGSFTQTGDNAGNANTLAGLSVSGGTCTWDSALDGGTLTVSGTCAQSGAGVLAFNLKNVTLGTGFSGSIEFYDLIIPAGVTLTPAAGSTITVRRSMTIQAGGNYVTTNNPTLVLGGGNSVAGGTYTDANDSVNLGTVTVSGAFDKALATNMRTGALTITGAALNLSGRNLTTTGAITGTGSLVASGAEAVTVGGSMTVTTFTPASSTVTFNGAAASGCSGYTFHDLVMNLGAAATTLTPSAGITVTNGFTQTRGNFSAGTFTHGIAGAWDSSNANVNFTPGTSTIQLTSAAPGITTRAGQSFNNLTLNSGGTLGSAVTVSGSFTAANGGAGGALGLAGYTLTVAGNLNLRPGAVGATLTAGTSAVVLNGGAQTLTTNAQDFYDLTLSAGAGAVTVAGNLIATNILTVGAGRTLDLAANNASLSITNGTTNGGTILQGTAAATFTGLVSNAGGTLSGGSGTITLTAGITGGNFTGTTGTAFVGGVFTPVFTHNSGTVEFDGGAAQTFGAYTFSNLTINNPAGVSATGAVTAAGNLVLSSGVFDVAGNAFNLAGNASHAAGSLASTGTVTLNGAAAQGIDLSTSSLNNLTVANAAGASLTDALTLGGNVTINAGAIFSTGGNGLTVTGTAAVNGALNFAGAGTTTVGGNLTVGAAGTTVNPAGSTLDLNGAAAQVLTPNAQTFGTVSMTGTGGVSMVGTATFGSLSVSVGEVFTLGGAAATNLTVTGASTNAGTLTFRSTAGVPASLSLGANSSNSGTLTLGASNAAGTATLSMANGTTLNNTGGTIQVSASAGTVSIVSPGTMTLSGNQLDLNGLTLHVNGFSTAVAHTLDPSDVLILDGTATFSGGLTLNGAGALVDVGAQTLNVSGGTGFTLTDGDAQVTTGTINATSGLTVTAGTASATTGRINTGASAVILAAGGSITFTGAGVPSLSCGAVTNAGTITLAGGTASTGSVTNTGTITFGTAAGAVWTAAGFFTSSGTVNNTFSNTISAGGSVAISGTFATPLNSTLRMTGSPTNLNAAVLLGNFIANAGGTITLAANLGLANDLTIQTGTLASGNFTITIAGNWTNATGVLTRFTPGLGLVEFTDPVEAVVSGPNQWYNLRYNQPGGRIRFQRNNIQRIVAGGTFQAIGTIANHVTITRDDLGDDGADLNWLTGVPPDPTLMWQLDKTGTGNLDFQHVDVWYSDARSNPIAYNSLYVTLRTVIPDDLPVAGEQGLTCYAWFSGMTVVYSYTEDSDDDGRIDRIRVTAQGALNMDFSDLAVDVAGYDIDTTQGVNGFTGVVGDPEFYIHLVEKPYLDSSRTPSWTFTNNTALKSNAAFPNDYTLVLNLADPMIPADTVPPRIAYTLAVPSAPDVFFAFNETVERAGGGVLTAAEIPGSVSVSLPGLIGDGDVYGVLAAYGGAISVANIVGELARTVDAGITDQAAPLYDWSTDPVASAYITTVPSYPAGSLPNPISLTSNSHRVSDLLVSVPPSDTVGAWSQVNPNSFFVWPLWAKDEAYVPGVPDVDYPTIPELDASGQYVGFVRLFDGSRFLRDQDFDMQVEDALGLGSAPELLYKSDVPDTFLSAVPGIWLPTYAEPDFSGLASYPYGGFSTNPGAGATPIWDYTFPASDLEIYDRARFEFYFRLPGYPADLYAGRLDMDPDALAIPADWYLRVRPFGILIRNVVTQKGGVSILNNVIDPTGGERTRLHYTIAQSGPVNITVFTLDGDVVRSLQRGTMTPGDYTASWDGRNRAGDPVARGMYFIRIVAPGIDEIRKVMVVRY